MTVDDVLNEAQSVFLHDPNASIYTDDKLLPVLGKVYRELQLELLSRQAQEVKEITAVLEVPANSTTLNAVAGYPTDVLSPISLEERADGSSDNFVPVTLVTWERFDNPNNPKEWIQEWAYREGEIKISKSSRAMEVRLKYLKGYTAIVGILSVIPDARFQGFLAARTAEIAAQTIGENPNRAAACGREAKYAHDRLMNIVVKQNQSLPVRRRRRRY